MREDERNPARYRALNVPRPPAELTAALDAFVEDVWNARLKHGIPDVLIIMKATRQDPDGDESDIITMSHCGNPANMGAMANFVAGVAEERMRTNFAHARSVGRKSQQ